MKIIISFRAIKYMNWKIKMNFNIIALIKVLVKTRIDENQLSTKKYFCRVVSINRQMFSNLNKIIREKKCFLIAREDVELNSNPT